MDANYGTENDPAWWISAEFCALMFTRRDYWQSSYSPVKLYNYYHDYYHSSLLLILLGEWFLAQVFFISIYYPIHCFQATQAFANFLHYLVGRLLKKICQLIHHMPDCKEKINREPTSKMKASFSSSFILFRRENRFISSPLSLSHSNGTQPVLVPQQLLLRLEKRNVLLPGLVDLFAVWSICSKDPFTGKNLIPQQLGEGLGLKGHIFIKFMIVSLQFFWTPE